MHQIRGACLAEQTYGVARGLENFVMVWAYHGLGAAVVAEKRMLCGQDHMAGELGHITVDRHGKKCGCGKIGCLETVATDAAFASAVSEKLGQSLELPEIIRLVQQGRINVESELEEVLEFSAIGIGAVINLFNPQAVLVCAGFLDVAPDALQRLSAKVTQHALTPLMQNCRILKARGDTREGAVASIIHRLTHALAPDMI